MKNMIQWILFLLIVGLLITTGSQNVSAAEKKATKLTVGELLKKVKEDSRGGKVKSTLEKSAAVIPDSQFQFKQNSTNLLSIKPPKSTELLKNDKGDDQVEYEKTLDRQIQELYGLTKKFNNNTNRGELWLRLAELYVEKASLVDFRKQDLYDKQLQAFQSGKTKVKPKLDTKESQAYNQRAIQLYEWFLRDYPKDEKVSQALFFLGYNYFELGKPEEGRKYYDQLTKNYPNSPFVGEAHFAVAEHLFDNEKWSEAYNEYIFLIKDKRHRLNTFALYKGGWCLYRLGKTEEGIKYLDYIIKSSKAETAKKNISRAKLESEALRDIVVFFSDIGDTQRAINYFTNLDVKDHTIYLERLAYYYAEKGNRDASRDVFHLLISEKPTSKKAFEYQYQIVQSYFYSKNSPQFKEELYKWINDYRKESAWSQENKADQAFLDNSYKLREQTLRNYVLQQHQTAQNSRAAFSRQNALQGYQLYFQEFSDSAQVADMHFFFGELLYDMNRFEEAATNYSWVAENAPQSKYGVKAGQNLLLSIEKALPKDEDLQKKVGDSLEPVPLDPRVEKFLKAANWYIEKFPKSDKNAEIKFRMGRLYYQSNHFNEAEAMFKNIVKNHQNTKFFEYSANLILDIYNVKKDYVGLEKVGSELLTNNALASSKTGADIRGVLERANFKKAQDLEAEKKYLESATQYQAFAKQNPTSDLAVLALFNSGVNFERSGHTTDAIANYKKLLKSTDKKADPLKPKVEKLLAKLYQEAGLFEESAQLFKKIADENPKDPLRPNYIFNAAVMYEALGKNKEAIVNYNEFYRVSKSFKERTDALFTLGELNRKAGARVAAIGHYKEYTANAKNTARKVKAYYWMYQLAQVKSSELGQEGRDGVINTHRRLSGDEKAEAATYVAKIRFPEAVSLYNQLKAVKVPSNPNKQKAAIDKKLAFLNQGSNLITEIIKLDSAEEIVASLDLLGLMNENIGEAFTEAPVPAELKAEQVTQYKEGIAKLAEPFYKKSLDSYKAAVEKSNDLDVYTAASRHSLEALTDKDPKSYYAGEEIINDSKQIEWIGEK